ncbi:MAG TPA: aspartate/glutamate racemase family protein [Bacillota bacterium]|nr:aspartate/glutamate racemase family protein [Bacillota bacterium]
MRIVKGGYISYGQLAGILMLDSTGPRVPGDLGHAETFAFPVRYGSAVGFPFTDLIEGKRDNLPLVIAAVQELAQTGVRFVAADCGLFSVFHREISNSLAIPFLSSGLMLIPWLRQLYKQGEIGVLTGDTRLLTDLHLQPIGASLEDVVLEGMENSAEFNRVVINRGDNLDLDKFGQDVLTAGLALKEKHPDIKAVILECTNLITYKTVLQEHLQLPVYDILSLVNLTADGFIFKTFSSTFI